MELKYKHRPIRRVVGKTLDIAAAATEVAATTTGTTGVIIGGLVSAVGIGTILAVGCAADLISSLGGKIKAKADHWQDTEVLDENGKVCPCKIVHVDG